MGTKDGMTLNNQRNGETSTLTESHDPIAKNLTWAPLSQLGANFKSQKLTVSPRTISVKQKGTTEFIAGLFVVVGLIAAILGVRPWFVAHSGIEIPFILVGVFFVLIGWSAFRGRYLLVFDRGQGRYFSEAQQNKRGQRPSSGGGGYLSDIHALQLLTKEVQSNISNTGTSGINFSVSSRNTFICHELNLVLKNGARVSVLNQTDLDSMREAASTLGRFLHVPVWEADANNIVRRHKKWTSRGNIFVLTVFVLLVVWGGGKLVTGLLTNNNHLTLAEWKARHHIGMPSPKVAQMLAQLPKDVFKPDFCTFNALTTAMQGNQHNLTGTMQLPILKAGDQVNAFMKTTQWQLSDVIKQSDAAALFYDKDNIELSYTFLFNSGAPNECMLSWTEKTH